MIRVETCPCKTCGKSTPMLGTKLCDGCWEVERRLADYLREGGDNARKFVEDALTEDLRRRIMMNMITADKIAPKGAG